MVFDKFDTAGFSRTFTTYKEKRAILADMADRLGMKSATAAVSPFSGASDEEAVKAQAIVDLVTSSRAAVCRDFIESVFSAISQDEFSSEATRAAIKTLPAGRAVVLANSLEDIISLDGEIYQSWIIDAMAIDGCAICK